MYSRIKNLTLLLPIAYLASISLTVHAETVSEAVQKCSVEPNSLKRLVCFDRIAKNMRQYDGLDEAVTTKLPLPASTPSAAPVTPRTAPAPRTDQQAKDEVRDFGFDKPSAEESALVDGTLYSVVSAVQEFKADYHKITLENGQVWEQTSSTNVRVPKIGDRIRIEKGALGTFSLFREGSHRKMRVKRIQ